MNSIAVIGAGPGGLAAVETLKRSNIWNIDCYEQRGALGGIWSKEDSPVHIGMQANISRYNQSFSTFNGENCRSVFMNRDEAYEYLEAYAANFSLKEHIHAGTSVIAVRLEDNEKWSVTFLDPDGKEGKRYYDKVIAASGFFVRGLCPILVEEIISKK
jgi:cation diffusion facilitator CzcD-associated flavoprotein CzcO